jgi:hypothetical protein
MLQSTGSRRPAEARTCDAGKLGLTGRGRQQLRFPPENACIRARENFRRETRFKAKSESQFIISRGIEKKSADRRTVDVLVINWLRQYNVRGGEDLRWALLRAVRGNCVCIWGAITSQYKYPICPP